MRFEAVEIYSVGKLPYCGEDHMARNGGLTLGTEGLSPTGTEFCQQLVSLEEDPRPQMRLQSHLTP